MTFRRANSRDGERGDLPVAEMRGENDGPPAFPHGQAQMVPALERQEPQPLGGRDGSI